MKNGKAPGIDSLQADISTTSRLLTGLFSKVWEEEVIPNDWTKGLTYMHVYSRSQRKAISATVKIGGELPYSLYQVRYFAGYCLSALKRLSIRHSERNRLGLEEEEVVWIRFLLYETSWNSRSNATHHLFASTLSIFKRHLIACIERVYGRSFKHMDYHPRLSTLSRCSITTLNVVSSLETPLQKHFQ